MVVGWPLTFLWQGQICAPIYFYGENIEKSFFQWIIKTNGWSLQSMIKVVKLFSFCQNLWGSWRVRGIAIYMYKIVKSLNVFFSETAWTVFTRFHIVHTGLSVERIWHFVEMVLCHSTRWLPCPYMVKHLKSFFSRSLLSLLKWWY